MFVIFSFGAANAEVERFLVYIEGLIIVPMYLLLFFFFVRACVLGSAEKSLKTYFCTNDS